MRRRFILLLAILTLLCAAGCAKEKTAVFTDRGYTKAEEFGSVPEEYKAIVEGDLLNGLRLSGCIASGGRFLTDRYSEKGREVTLYDSFGALLAKHFIPNEELEDRFIDLLLVSSDGGFIYAIESNVVSDEGGNVKVINSLIVKCGADGEVEWTTEIDSINAKSFCRMIERNGAYYVFGEYSNRPLDGYDHIFMLKMGLDGSILRQNTVAGSDFDSLRRVDETDAGFTLHVNSQSRNGDFFELKKETPPYFGRYFVVQTDLELEEKNVKLGKTDYCDLWYRSAGTLKGKIVEQNMGMKDVPGFVKLVLDNGDTYLVVSENNTGVYEHTPPMINSIWCYTETVYSVFDKDGKLIARRTYDSSTQWDLVLKAFNSEYYRE